MSTSDIQTLGIAVLLCVICVMGFHMVRRYSKEKDWRSIAEQQCADSRRLALIYQASAEEHQALALMHEERVKRLTEVLEPAILIEGGDSSINIEEIRKRIKEHVHKEPSFRVTAI